MCQLLDRVSPEHDRSIWSWMGGSDTCHQWPPRKHGLLEISQWVSLRELVATDACPASLDRIIGRDGRSSRSRWGAALLGGILDPYVSSRVSSEVSAGNLVTTTCAATAGVRAPLVTGCNRSLQSSNSQCHGSGSCIQGNQCNACIITLHLWSMLQIF